MPLVEAFRAVGRGPRPVLDEVDVQLLELLCDDGRRSNRELAREVGLTEATVALRLRELVDKRILHIGASLDWKAAGYECELHVLVSVVDRMVKDVGRAIAAIDGVLAVMEIFGQFDLTLRVILPDLSHVTRFQSQLAEIPGVHTIESVVVSHHRKYVAKLAERFTDPGPIPTPVFPNPVIPLDRLDHALIRELLDDGRRANREIARRLDVHESTVRARLKRIQEAGILRIHGQINAAQAGLVAAWSVVAVKTASGGADAVGARIADLPEVVALMHTTGRHDLVFYAFAPTRGHLVRLVTETIRMMPAVRSTETHEIIGTVNVAFHWVRFLDSPDGEARD